MTATALAIALAVAGALAAGILVGRYYVPDDRALKRAARHARIYMRALNDLLARDRDAAIEELRRAVAENVSDLEPYFALGALFRGRGEWERAIRIHQALELRAKGDKKLRRRARFELGLDFRTAGMPRRAIRALEECLAETPKHEVALRALAGLYEQTERYAEAASAWRRLRKLTGERPPRELHMAAEAARRAIAAGDLEAGKRHARDAERLDAKHPHALAAAAELAEARGSLRPAAEHYARLAAAAPELSPVAVEGLRRVERARLPNGAPDSDVSAAILGRLEALGDAAAQSPHLRLAAARLRREAGEVTEAERALRALVRERPDVLPAHIELARRALEAEGEGAAADALAALAGEAGALAWVGDGCWRCSFCSRPAEAFSWRCGGCRQWGRMRLEIGREALAPAPAARDRRAEPRAAPTSSLAPSGGAELASDADGDDAGGGDERSSPARRAGAWVAGAVRSLRSGRERERAPESE